jgi:HAD superfamily hydrolase (TIGR01509 family)
MPPHAARPALICDLDGTLVDTVYAHVLAWSRALRDFGIDVPAARIHLRVGMSGALVAEALTREVGRPLSAKERDALGDRHAEHYRQILPDPVAIPGAIDLIERLRELGVPFGIATSGKRKDAEPALATLHLASDVPVIDGSQVQQAKPDPAILFACQERLGVSPQDCIVVGDAVWDHLAARRAHMTSVGVLTGGIAATDLYHAGAIRVLQDVAELAASLGEIGIA